MEKKINKQLNILLANMQVHYQNLRSLHWNIKGSNFFEMHVKYEELYNESQIVIDDLAERILMRDGVPLHSLKSYLENSEIEEVSSINSASKGMNYIEQALNINLKKQKEILELTDKANDEATNSLISDLIRSDEKQLWMVKAWLNK